MGCNLLLLILAFDLIFDDDMLADENFVCRHCATGGRFLHWLGYRDKNGVALSKVKFVTRFTLFRSGLCKGLASHVQAKKNITRTFLIWV